MPRITPPAPTGAQIAADPALTSTFAPLVSPDAVASGETVPQERRLAAGTVATGNQTLRLHYFTARKTETINTIGLACVGAAGATPTLVRVGIFSIAGNGDGTLVASTPNDTALLAVAATRYTKGLSAPLSKVLGQRYAAGVLVVTGAAAPTLAGSALTSSLFTGQAYPPVVIGAIGSQADLPASFAANAVGTSGGGPFVELIP